MLHDLKEGLKQNPIWFGSIGAIAAVQGWLGWEFWGALTDKPVEQAGLRAVGLAFVGAEVVALDMASRHALDGDRTRANVLRAMWVSLALLNLGVDVGSFSRVIDASDAPRELLIQQERARAAERQDLSQRIDKADDPFGNALLGVEAYDLALTSKAREIDLARAAPRWRQRQLESERGALQIRRQTALQVAAWQSRFDELNNASRTAPPAPEIGEQFEALGETLTNIEHAVQAALGQDPHGKISAEDARNGISVMAVAMMKALLTAGLWLGLERRFKTTTSIRAEILLPDREAEKQTTSLPAQPNRPALPAPRRGTQSVQRFGRKGSRLI